MELKKTPQADLENERTTFFLLGFTVVLSSLFVLLEWSSEDTLPVAWDNFSPAVIIENEYKYDEALIAALDASETTPEVEGKQEPEIVYEGYHIEEKVPEETVPAVHPEMSVRETTDTERSLPEISAVEQAVTIADVMPQYPGGYAALNRYLFDNLKYPVSASSQRIGGRVWCSFIVNKDGSLANIQIEKSVYISLDQEALLVLKTMPAWIPGTVRGNPVQVKVYLPIVFKL